MSMSREERKEDSVRSSCEPKRKREREEIQRGKGSEGEVQTRE